MGKMCPGCGNTRQWDKDLICALIQCAVTDVRRVDNNPYFNKVRKDAKLFLKSHAIEELISVFDLNINAKDIRKSVKL